MTALLALCAALAGYGLVCRRWPLKSCRSCSGSGKRRGPLGSAFRLCSRCGGSGRQERWGAGIFRGTR
jgi:DnaJ-class molecular chaperone